MPRVRQLPDSRLVHVTDLLTAEELKTSPTYNEALPQGGCQDGLTVGLDGPDGSHITWCVGNPLDAGGLGGLAGCDGDALLPHVRQFVRVRHALVRAEARNTTVTDLLDNARMGVVHLDRRGRLMAANDRARGRLRRGDGLSDRDGTLRARTPGRPGASGGPGVSRTHEFDPDQRSADPMNDNSRRPVVRIAAPLAIAALCAAFAANAFSQDGAASDRRVLETLYRATGGDDWTDNTNWLTTAPLGDWHGVEVDEDERVTGLRLGGWDEAAQGWVDHQSTGSLPPALGTLSRLRRLEISGNGGLTGPIPPELGSPGDLEELILLANSLTGSIPAALGHLSSLKRLLLGFNLLSGQIPPEFGNLTGLEHLEVGDTMLSGPLPESLTTLSTLDWLRLEGSWREGRQLH